MTINQLKGSKKIIEITIIGKRAEFVLYFKYMLLKEK